MTQDMLASALPIAAAPLGLAGHMLGHVAAARLRPDLSILRAFFAGFPCGLAIFILYEVLCLSFQAAASASLWSALADLVAFLALSYTYFHFANMSYGARRVRLLREIASSPDGLSPISLLSRYNAREMLDNRLDRLLASRQISIVGNRIHGGQSAVRGMAACLALLKRLIFGNRQRSDLPNGLDALLRAITEHDGGA